MGTGIKKDCVILILSFGAPCSVRKKKAGKEGKEVKEGKKGKEKKSKRAKKENSKEDKEERSSYACGKR